MVKLIKDSIWIKAVVILIIGILLNDADAFIFEKLKKGYDKLETNITKTREVNENKKKAENIEKIKTLNTNIKEPDVTVLDTTPFLNYLKNTGVDKPLAFELIPTNEEDQYKMKVRCTNNTDHTIRDLYLLIKTNNGSMVNIQIDDSHLKHQAFSEKKYYTGSGNYANEILAYSFEVEFNKEIYLVYYDCKNQQWIEYKYN